TRVRVSVFVELVARPSADGARGALRLQPREQLRARGILRAAFRVEGHELGDRFAVRRDHVGLAVAYLAQDCGELAVGFGGGDGPGHVVILPIISTGAPVKKKADGFPPALRIERRLRYSRSTVTVTGERTRTVIGVPGARTASLRSPAITIPAPLPAPAVAPIRSEEHTSEL